LGCVDSPQTFRSAVASAPCSHQFAAPPPRYTFAKPPRAPAKNSPGHPQSTEPQQGTRASHSVARHAQHRGSTPKTVQNIRPAAAKEKSDQDRKRGPATVASLINTQPTQRLHHQATGLRGNIFCSPVWPSYFSLLFTSYHRFTRFAISVAPFPPHSHRCAANRRGVDLQASSAWQSESFDSYDDFDSASILPASCLRRQSSLWWWM
jgi:pyruvate/2-oxoglutarate dehydrogenase complex dihydrolipoamide acyltransferase (E2) component